MVPDTDEAADLARLLDLIEDWHLHADDDARADLAGSGHGHLATAGLITAVEQTALTLHRRLSANKETQRPSVRTSSGPLTRPGSPSFVDRCCPSA